MKILVFVGKEVGLECLNFLVGFFQEDEYTILVHPEEKEITDFLRTRGISFYYLEGGLKEVNLKENFYFDWLLNLWGSHILRGETLSKAKKSLNIHPSLLPYCRGRDPIVWALRYRLPAGVTLHSITEGIDEGPIWVQEEVPYSTETTGKDLYQRCLEKSKEIFKGNWGSIRSSQTPPFPQGEIKNSKTFKRKDFLREGKLDLDENSLLKDFVYKALAHEFNGKYKLKVNLGGEEFLLSINLERTEEV